MTERVKKYLSILELSYCRDAISFRHSEMDFLFYRNMELEIWKDIQGFEGHYQISNLGKVKSLKFGKERILKNRLNCCNYYSVMLSNGAAKRTDTNIHRLIALHFIPKPVGIKTEVNHKDNNRQNNSIENLEWITHAENIRHGKSFHNGKRPVFSLQDHISIK